MAPVFEDITDETAPLILYIDVNNRLQVGTWGYEVTKDNAIFTQFGSTVGFTHTGDTWGSGDVVFNPTSMLDETFEAGSAGYQAIPYWNSWPGTKAYTEGYISSTPYHTVTNVKAGFGDICQLVGYAAENIPAWSELPPAAYRLPTRVENHTFVGYTSGVTSNDYNLGTTYGRFTSGSPGYMTFPNSTPANQVLPALGERLDTGAPTVWGTGTGWWSSTPNFFHIWMSSGHVIPSRTEVDRHGHAVRCVRQ